MKKVEKIIVHCDFCGGEVKKYRYRIRKTNFCDINCKSNYQRNQKLTEGHKEKIGLAVSGDKNGMWRKNHSEKTCEKIRTSRLLLFEKNPALKFECGNSRLNKKDRYEIIKKGHKNRDNDSYKSHSHTDKSKKIIGIKSSMKFTEEYKLKIRKKLEREGKIVPLNKIKDYKFYLIISNWIERMYDHIYSEKQLSMLKEYGILNTKKNKKGLVRDHIYSRKSGFMNEVFPEILRHPFNCQLLSNSDNAKKRDNNEYTLKKLFLGIKIWNYPWQEQEKCIHLIKEYEKGKRYNKEKYIHKYYKIISPFKSN